MNRREMLAAVGFGSACTLAGQAAETLPETDPWVGTYLKFAQYDSKRKGQFGEAQEITITKTPQGYSLGKPYPGREFREVKKGVLSDGKGGYGTLCLGTAEYADGTKASIVRADFCYETFVLYGLKVIAQSAD